MKDFLEDVLFHICGLARNIVWALLRLFKKDVISVGTVD